MSSELKGVMDIPSVTVCIIKTVPIPTMSQPTWAVMHMSSRIAVTKPTSPTKGSPGWRLGDLRQKLLSARVNVHSLESIQILANFVFDTTLDLVD